jgi:hypothetical protein
MDVNAVPLQKENSVAQWAVTSTTLDAAAAIVVVFFASPISQATKLYRPASLYFQDGLPHWGFLASLTLSLTLAFGVVLVLCSAAARAGVRPRIIERVLAVAVIFGAAFQLASRSTIALMAGAPLALVAAAICVYGARLGEISRAIVWRLGRLIGLGCLALLCYEVADAVFSHPEPGRPRFITPAQKSHTIMVLLFDELDEELAFRLRPQRITIPNLTEFDRQALHATRVSPIASMTTTAIPSLLTGRQLRRAEPESAQVLELYTGDKTTRRAWDARNTLFAELKASGINSAVLGWHHPYCRVLASEIAACVAYPNVDATDPSRLAFYYGRRGPMLMPPLASLPWVGIAAQLRAVAEEQYSQVRRGLETLVSWISDRRLGFIWAHFPLPHPPGMLAGQARSLQPNYFDNLALVDDTVGIALAELKRNGRWDDSIVVITSDHGLRRDIWQPRPGWTKEEDRQLAIRGKREFVPLIVHLPQQDKHVSFAQPLSAMVLHDLILEWSQGRLIQPDVLISWVATRN